MRSLLSLLLAMTVLAGCTGSQESDEGRWTSADAIEAFRAAGLELGDTRPMTKDDYGFGPMKADEGTRFIVPSLCDADETPCDKGGRAMSFSDAQGQTETKDYYESLGRESAMLFSWVFEKDNLVVQINGDLPETEARRYEAALASLAESDTTG